MSVTWHAGDGVLTSHSGMRVHPPLADGLLALPYDPDEEQFPGDEEDEEDGDEDEDWEEDEDEPEDEPEWLVRGARP